jgi:Flp pilus assembly protein TadD
MRWLRNRGIALGFAGALLAQAGCVSLNRSGPNATNTSLSSARSDEHRLPKDQAIKASLAVAQDLDHTGNEAGAVEQYEKLQELEPKNLQVARRLAVLYDRKCDFAKADAQYRKLAQAQPKNADLLNDWGYSYYLRNKWGDAEKQLRHALEIDPKNDRARCNLGLALGQQGRYDEALKTFRAAHIEDAEAHGNLAFIYWSQGKFDEAKRECLEAQRLDPASVKAKEMLSQLDRPMSAVADAGKPARGRGPARAGAESLDRRRDAERERVLAQLGDTNKGASLPTPIDVPNLATPVEAPPQPVYRSPSGTLWAPTKPSTPPAAPVQGVQGTVTFD